VLFLPYQADQIAALRSIISTWMRFGIFQTLSLGEGDRRMWFAVDELDALGPIDGLSDALPRLRKFGGRCALGFQSISHFHGFCGSCYWRGTWNSSFLYLSNGSQIRCRYLCLPERRPSRDFAQGRDAPISGSSTGDSRSNPAAD
jgi:hypothetical protein